MEPRQQLERGFATVTRLARFGPFSAGPEVIHADSFGYFALGSATRTVKAAYNSVPGIRPLLSRVPQRENVKRVDPRAAGLAGLPRDGTN